MEIRPDQGDQFRLSGSSNEGAIQTPADIRNSSVMAASENSGVFGGGQDPKPLPLSQAITKDHVVKNLGAPIQVVKAKRLGFRATIAAINFARGFFKRIGRSSTFGTALRNDYETRLAGDRLAVIMQKHHIAPENWFLGLTFQERADLPEADQYDLASERISERYDDWAQTVACAQAQKGDLTFGDPPRLAPEYGRAIPIVNARHDIDAAYEVTDSKQPIDFAGAFELRGPKGEMISFQFVVDGTGHGKNKNDADVSRKNSAGLVEQACKILAEEGVTEDSLKAISKLEWVTVGIFNGIIRDSGQFGKVATVSTDDCCSSHLHIDANGTVSAAYGLTGKGYQIVDQASIDSGSYDFNFSDGFGDAHEYHVFNDVATALLSSVTPEEWQSLGLPNRITEVKEDMCLEQEKQLAASVQFLMQLSSFWDKNKPEGLGDLFELSGVYSKQLDENLITALKKDEFIGAFCTIDEKEKVIVLSDKFIECFSKNQFKEDFKDMKTKDQHKFDPSNVRSNPSLYPTLFGQVLASVEDKIQEGGDIFHDIVKRDLLFRNLKEVLPKLSSEASVKDIQAAIIENNPKRLLRDRYRAANNILDAKKQNEEYRLLAEDGDALRAAFAGTIFNEAEYCFRSKSKLTSNELEKIRFAHCKLPSDLSFPPGVTLPAEYGGPLHELTPDQFQNMKSWVDRYQVTFAADATYCFAPLLNRNATGQGPDETQFEFLMKNRPDKLTYHVSSREETVKALVEQHLPKAIEKIINELESTDSDIRRDLAAGKPEALGKLQKELVKYAKEGWEIPRRIHQSPFMSRTLTETFGTHDEDDLGLNLCPANHVSPVTTGPILETDAEQI